ncbi:carboxymuconolactone decarboxylase family protein [Actinoallomurus soli]|uniref:carboxymuconolactone decarboxylase family protein n=1 Tax=Actinoallomurus soli TaxID=2952535 RepID=UPI002093A4D7|nr:carboxymuconolactone decarboxylase family protein [Actinoallomurus soli]MCO5971016.1 carboxymuconolactone decarboxylase family protein [Actinoallomurus soli]
MRFPSDSQLKALDPVFAEMSAATDRMLWDELPELSTREKILLSLVADVCGQTLGLPFETHVAMARGHGLSADDLRELLRFIAYDSGYPAALAALARLTGIEQEQGLTGPTGHGHEVNADGQESPIPAPARRAVRNLDAPFAGYMDLQSRMRAGMNLLSVRERAFATMTVDVLYQTLDESFRLHVTRALAAGATPDEARAVVRFSARFGMTKAWRALRVLESLFTETGTVFA